MPRTAGRIALSVLFAVSLSTAAQAQELALPDTFGTYAPGRGFRIAETSSGTLNFRLYTYFRYLNQLGLDDFFVDSFGDTTFLDPRQDFQMQKFNAQFYGWILNPRLRYLAYVWTSNSSLGQTSQVVVGGNLQYRFEEWATVGVGIGALPGVRSTEGNFPFWLSEDNRLIADEFFRPSYTTGLWSTGVVAERLRYHVMVGNNLSQFGIDAGQLDAQLKTYSAALVWKPTSEKERWTIGFGDFAGVTIPETRLGAHFTNSVEEQQGQPGTEAPENAQIRLSDGNIIFESDLFGPGISVNEVEYSMATLDAGVKYRGLSLDAEHYWRWLTNLSGPGVESLSFDELTDTGFQLLASGFVVPRTVQLYAGTSKIFGDYGDPWEARGGVNWHPWKNEVARWNVEFLYTDGSPVGALSLPYAVGSTGSIVYTSLRLNF